MSYQVLARKWRPKRFQEVIGQVHITRSLQHAITGGKLGHAYIFSGTRGIGKTSVARLFAKALRCENPTADGNPCDNCSCCQDFDTGSSMNVLEIDGASNNGVDSIRDLVSEVQYLPTCGKYKVYIIDEVHMVTNQGFNALLKTLEEPPEHVIFIFATTEPEKLLGTVLSRCQRFDFRNVSVQSLVKHLKNIGEIENITFENEDLIRQISVQGNGSVRDTLSLLDQVLSFTTDNHVSEEVVAVSLGLARSSVIKDISAAIILGDAKRCSTLYRGLLNENVDVKNIMTAVLDTLFEIIENMDNVSSLYEKRVLPTGALNDISAAELFWVYETMAKDVSWVLNSIDPYKIAEILLQKVCLRRSFFDQGKPLSTTIPQEENIEKKKEPVVETAPVETTSVETVEEEPVAPVVEDKVEGPVEQKTEEKVIKQPLNHVKDWDGFLAFLEGKAPASAANLEQGNIIKPLEMIEGEVHVDLGFDQSGKVFFDYLNETEVKKKLTDNIAEYFECDPKVVNLNLVLVDEQVKKEVNFKSKAEMKELEKQQLTEDKKEAFLRNPLIQEAEELFNTKIDKVIIGKENR